MPRPYRSPNDSMQAAGQSANHDTVTIENSAVGTFGIFNSLAITNDFTKPSEAAFDVGNDESYNDLMSRAAAMGAEFKVFVNDRLHMTGRVEMNGAPITVENGVTAQFVVRTKLADAFYASADPDTRYKNTRIGDFIEAIFKPLGYSAADFVVRANLSRDLMTGRDSKGKEPPVPLDTITEDQLKINPPETIYAAADRILKRHGLMLWDSPDGKITIGAPNDTQAPLYHLHAYNDRRSRLNNITSATRTRDISQVPSVLSVYGVGGKLNWRAAKSSALVRQPDVLGPRGFDGKPVFYRPVIVIQESVKNDKFATRYANREMSNRSKNLDSWEVEVDGLAYWNGQMRIPYGIDTVAEIDTSLAGGPLGAYLVTKVTKKRDAMAGDTTRLTLLKKGLWQL